LTLPVVAQLKDDSAYENLYRLLEIFAKEGYSQYFQLVQQTPNFITELGLVPDNIVAKIRIISLLSVGSKQNKISYDEAAKLMGIDVSEVEMLVVEAITLGLLDARLDQLQKTIIVRHADPRIYEKEQWEQLANKLDKWKANITSLFDVIHNTKQLGIDAKTESNTHQTNTQNTAV